MINLPVKIVEMKEQYEIFFVELYVLHLKTGDVYFVACDEEITFDGNLYFPQPIERGAVKSTVDAKIDNCELKISNVTDEFTTALFQGYDFRGDIVDVIQIIYPDSLSDPSIFRWVFSGYMDTPILDEKEKLFKVTLKAYMPNMTTGRICMLSCNAEFGDPEDCGISIDKQSGTVKPTSDQNTIVDEVRQEVVDYWKGGLITIQYETKRIISSYPGVIQTEYPFSFYPVGMSYSIERGCDKTQKTCIERFGNGINFSGYPAIPFELIIRT